MGLGFPKHPKTGGVWILQGKQKHLPGNKKSSLLKKDDASFLSVATSLFNGFLLLVPGSVYYTLHTVYVLYILYIIFTVHEYLFWRMPNPKNSGKLNVQAGAKIYK